MIFEQLSEQERDILLKLPAVVSIFAAISNDGEVSSKEKAQSIKLSHLRTYTSSPLLHDYYKEVDKVFEQKFESILADLPPDTKDKEVYLENEITSLNKVLPKLDSRYAKELVDSLKTFSKHVFKSDSNFLKYFVLPIFLNKIEKESFNPKIGE